MHKVNADDVMVEFFDHIHWVRKFLSSDPQIDFVYSYGIHSIAGGSNTALRIGDLPWFLMCKGHVKGPTVHAGDGCSDVK